MAKFTTAHPGFEATAEKIAKREGITIQAARRMLAKKSRTASTKAKLANPRLERVSQPNVDKPDDDAKRNGDVKAA